MKIFFGKEVRGYQQLKEFLLERDTKLYIVQQGLKGQRGYVLRFNCEIDRLKDSLVNEIENSIRSKGLETIRASKDNLWINKPEECILNLCAKATDPFYWGEHHFGIDSSDVERIGDKKGLIFRRPLYRVIPKATIDGEVSYERPERAEQCSNPVFMLEILKSLGYGSRVITTQEEIMEHGKRTARNIEQEIRDAIPRIVSHVRSSNEIAAIHETNDFLSGR